MIDAAVLTEPRCWLVSKVNRDNVKGIVVVTCKQDTANQHTFKADYDEDGNVIAWWADWEASAIAPTKGVSDEIPDQEDDDFSPAPSLTSTVTCSGKRQIKIGGSMKTLTVRFTDGYGEAVEYQPGEWSFTIDDEPLSEDLLTYTDVAENKIKIKFHGGDDYIGKILTATFTSNETVASLQLEIIAL